VVSGNPDVIVAIGPPTTLAARAATGTIPIVASGTETSSGVVPRLARPGGNMTGVRVQGSEIYGKRLQILKEAVPFGVQGRVSRHRGVDIVRISARIRRIRPAPAGCDLREQYK
jgi:hypothetical protein